MGSVAKGIHKLAKNVRFFRERRGFDQRTAQEKMMGLCRAEGERFMCVVNSVVDFLTWDFP